MVNFAGLEFILCQIFLILDVSLLCFMVLRNNGKALQNNFRALINNRKVLVKNRKALVNNRKVL